jgi:hypothetical protein
LRTSGWSDGLGVARPLLELPDEHGMLDVLDFHLIATSGQIYDYLGIDPNPYPYPRLDLFPDLAIR